MQEVPASEESPQAMTPQVVEPEPDVTGEVITEPTKLIRIASMTRAMLEEVRQAPLDEEGRKRLGVRMNNHVKKTDWNG